MFYIAPFDKDNSFKIIFSAMVAGSLGLSPATVIPLWKDSGSLREIVLHKGQRAETVWKYAKELRL